MCGEVREGPTASGGGVRGQGLGEGVVANNPPRGGWASPADRTAFRWKQDGSYTLTGNLHNNAQFAQMSIVPVIHEEDGTFGETDLRPRDFSPTGGATLTIGTRSLASIPFQISPAPQWDCFSRILLTHNAPLTRRFSYAVRFRGT